MMLLSQLVVLSGQFGRKDSVGVATPLIIRSKTTYSSFERSYDLIIRF